MGSGCRLSATVRGAGTGSTLQWSVSCSGTPATCRTPSRTTRSRPGLATATTGVRPSALARAATSAATGPRRSESTFLTTVADLPATDAAASTARAAPAASRPREWVSTVTMPAWVEPSVSALAGNRERRTRLRETRIKPCSALSAAPLRSSATTTSDTAVTAPPFGASRDRISLSSKEIGVLAHVSRAGRPPCLPGAATGRRGWRKTAFPRITLQVLRIPRNGARVWERPNRARCAVEVAATAQ